MKRPAPVLVLLLLLVAAASIATVLQPQAVQWNQRAQSDDLLQILLGDGRRLFADHFYIKADVYFHSGYYPSIFDQARQVKEKEDPLTGERVDQDAQDHEKEMDFLGPPKDWVDRFGRHFRITEHTHLEGGNAREILPWLRLSAELDPQRVDTYAVAAYWLRTQLGRPAEARQFLLEGLRANLHSYELLFELGSLYYENDHDADRARNIWNSALGCWQKQESGKKEPDTVMLSRIALNLAHLEEEQGNLDRAIQYFEMARKVSPDPGSLQKQIDALRAKLRSAVKQ